MIVVYTDGSNLDATNYRYQHDKSVKYGAYAYILDGLPNLNYFPMGKIVMNQQINVLELAAVVHSLQVLYQAQLFQQSIMLVTDSDYVYRGFNQLTENTVVDSQKISNAEFKFWNKLRALKFQFTHLQIKCVKSHQANLGNQLAHKFAYQLVQKALETH